MTISKRMSSRGLGSFCYLLHIADVSTYTLPHLHSGNERKKSTWAIEPLLVRVWMGIKTSTPPLLYARLPPFAQALHHTRYPFKMQFQTFLVVLFAGLAAATAVPAELATRQVKDPSSSVSQHAYLFSRNFLTAK